MFEKSDQRNQEALQGHNLQEKPLITERAARVWAWIDYAKIALIVALLAVAIVVSLVAS